MPAQARGLFGVLGGSQPFSKDAELFGAEAMALRLKRTEQVLSRVYRHFFSSLSMLDELEDCLILRRLLVETQVLGGASRVLGPVPE